MSKYNGDWIIYEYFINNDTLEEIYTINLEYSESNNLFTFKSLKLVENIDHSNEYFHKEINIKKHGIYNHETNTIIYNKENKENKTETQIEFKSDNLFRGYKYKPINFEKIKKLFFGIKKANNQQDKCALAGTWNLSEKLIDETLENTANIKLLFSCSAAEANSLHSSFFIEGEYYNFDDLEKNDT